MNKVVTRLCGASKGFMKAFKAFIKPFEAPQRNFKVLFSFCLGSVWEGLKCRKVNISKLTPDFHKIKRVLKFYLKDYIFKSNVFSGGDLKGNIDSKLVSTFNLHYSRFIELTDGGSSSSKKYDEIPGTPFETFSIHDVQSTNDGRQPNDTRYPKWTI